MKIFAVLLAILVLISSGMAFSNDICRLPYGQDGFNGFRCRAAIESWSYKADTDECVFFIYGGCGGNANRFYSLEECEAVCM